MIKLRIIGAIFSCICFFSCQKEFTVTTDKQESYAAFCLLNLKDSSQYVRINRIFLSSDDPAQYIQNPDSVNIHPEDYEVAIQPYLEGVAEDIILLYPSEDYEKEEGLFAGNGYQLFKTNQSLQPDRVYFMTIRNIITGFEMKAETGLLGRRTIENTFKETRYYDINQYTPELIDYDGDLNPGQWDKIIERFLYYEYAGHEVRMKYVDWRDPMMKKHGMHNDTAAYQLSDEFLKYLAQEIPEDTSVKRKAVGLDKMLVLNDEALAIYIDFSEDQSSGHYIPDLTNFDEGTGILASRYYYTYFAMKFRKQTHDTLAYGRFTRHLRFSDGNGNWPP